MSCIDALGERNPCIYGGVLTVVTLTAAAAFAIGVITLLANQHMLTFSAFSISTPWSLGMSVTASLFLGGILILAIRACCKKKHIEESLDQTPSSIPTGPDTPSPHSPLHPSGKSQPIGASGGPSQGSNWGVKKGARNDEYGSI